MPLESFLVKWHGHVEVPGGQVGEPVRGHLVRHREHVHQVLHGQVAGLLGVGQEAERGLLRHQHRRGEVVALDPLAQEVREVPRRLVPEQEVPERLQQDRARRVRADRLLPHVDPVVAQVGQRPDGTGQVLHVPDGETVVADHRQQHALRQGAAGVARRFQRAVRRPLDVLEVVGALAHGRAQFGVGGARLLRRRGRAGSLLTQRARQLHQVLQHLGRHPGADLQVRQAELGVAGIALRFLQGDLQLRPAAGRPAAAGAPPPAPTARWPGPPAPTASARGGRFPAARARTARGPPGRPARPGSGHGNGADAAAADPWS